MAESAGAAARLDPVPATLVRNPDDDELEALIAWLDDGQREGVRGALEAEYPTALCPPNRQNHFVATFGEHFASHAYVRVVEVVADGRRLRIGMIGLVYTDPAHRKRGLARRCIEACVSRLAELDVPIAVLWSDRRSFYAKLGFEPAGREVQYLLTPEDCAEARRRLPGPYRVATARPEDFRAAEELHDAKPVHVARAPGDLARLAAAPDSRVVVARSGSAIVAYAARGRGADFSGVVHEWAGEAGGVAACLAELARGREALGWLTGPVEETPVATFRAAGALPAPGCFALCRVLDVERLYQACTGNRIDASTRLVAAAGQDAGFAQLRTADAEIDLDHSEVLELLFGARAPRSVRRLRAQPDSRLRIADLALPYPLFVWGFDSV